MRIILIFIFLSNLVFAQTGKQKVAVTDLTRIKQIGSISPLIGDVYGYLAEERYDEMVLTLMQIFSEIPYNLHMKDEKFYHALLQIIFSAAGIETQSERLTSIGRMDMILELPYAFYVVELKIDEPPEKGLKQIEMQKYYEPFLYKGKPIRALALSFLRKKASNKENSHFTIDYAIKVLS